MRHVLGLLVAVKLCIALPFAGCIKPRVEKYYDNAHSRIESRGSMNNGVPYGYWEYYDTLGNIIEEGSYSNGWRTDEWQYHSSKFDTVIIWETFTDGNYSMNVPQADKAILSNEDSVLEYKNAFVIVNVHRMKQIMLNDSLSLSLLCPKDSSFNRYDVWCMRTASTAAPMYHFRGWVKDSLWVHSIAFENLDHTYIVTISFPFNHNKLEVYNVIYTSILTSLRYEGQLVFDDKNKVTQNRLVQRIVR